ncbi:N-acetyltransferase [Providencia alcalifaciens]|uniref:Acetyltransferase, GNAT family n=1 Tax=Providencia alcalifaciens DSM 30120 TaxID=520999 RepID=B6XHM6_9GAMM|nr:GNAT family N-acetyltransferase [Providencia alcalifaciens]ATG17456.1 N-acetyltransferase [Providencia alcalifaciens]EEB44839.1 acetyltransferase, GNAT family [Providencia alcalifaciens DSM 30120]SQI36683.1 ribosomal-protein-alanine acetyltransferase [Providencia alcalifaciens]
MIIRSACLSDVAVLTSLDTCVVTDLTRVQQIQNWIENKHCYLAEENGEVLGYGVLNYHFFGCGFIEMIMVGKQFRHQGIGNMLLNALKNHCQHPKLFTSTNQSNLLMQQLLLKSGFIPSGQINNLDENDPELIFYINKIL